MAAVRVFGPMLNDLLFYSELLILLLDRDALRCARMFQEIFTSLELWRAAHRGLSGKCPAPQLLPKDSSLGIM
jgi:hypothetical protein